MSDINPGQDVRSMKEKWRDFSARAGASFAAAGRSVKIGFAKLFSNRQACAGFCIIVFFVLVAIFGPLIFPYDVTTNYAERFLPPSWEHPFGTDEMGRDIFRQLISGTGNVLQIAFYTGLITVAVGTLLGIISGYVGGIVDKLIQGFANIVLTIPSFPVFLMLAALFTIESPIELALALSAWSWAGLCRSVRAQVMSIRERDFIQICSVMRMSKFHIIVKELFPNIISYVLINFIVAVRNAITGSVGIMMLGLAAYDPTNWGSMLERARNIGLVNPKVVPLLLTPLLAIMLFQIGTVLLSNGMDEIMNPRLRVN